MSSATVVTNSQEVLVRETAINAIELTTPITINAIELIAPLLPAPAGTGPVYSNSAPRPLGAATAGVQSSASRADHVHPMPNATQVGADARGTATAALAAHVASLAPHAQYVTLSQAAAAAPVQGVSLTPPSGWSSTTSSNLGNVTLTLTPPTGTSLVSVADRTAWDQAFSERLQWDGNATNLDANLARVSLMLGTAATRDTGATPGSIPLLDGSGKIPAITLPSYVDDVLEFPYLEVFPTVGETGKIYVALDSNLTYRWTGTGYVEITPSPGTTDAVPEGALNLYFTPLRASAAAPVQSVAGRTGNVTLAIVATSGAYNDLTGKPTLGGAATLNVGTTAGTVAAGDDPRLTTAVSFALAAGLAVAFG